MAFEISNFRSKIFSRITSQHPSNNVVVELARLLAIKQTKVCHYNYYKTQAPPNLLSGTFSLQSGQVAGSKFSTTFR